MYFEVILVQLSYNFPSVNKDSAEMSESYHEYRS